MEPLCRDVPPGSAIISPPRCPLRSMLKPTAVALFLALGIASSGATLAQAPPAGPASSTAARIDVDVRMMSAEEVRSRSGDSLLPPEAVGLFLVPQAILAPTTSDAVTATVVGPPGGVDFEAPARMVLSQLAASSLATDLAAEIRERMRAAALEAGDAWSFDVVIAYHGLRSEQWRPSVQSESASYCLITAGVVSVSGLQGPLDTSSFQRGVDVRSDGMPGPECKVLTDYAASGGTTLRRATRDMAAVLAAWIVNRTLQYR